MNPSSQVFTITLDKGMNPNCLVLIKSGNEAQTHDGRQIQLAHAAYIDGYTSATGEISKFISYLYQTDKATASLVHEALKPLCELQNQSYTTMCDRLNDRAGWDKDDGNRVENLCDQCNGQQVCGMILPPCLVREDEQIG